MTSGCNLADARVCSAALPLGVGVTLAQSRIGPSPPGRDPAENMTHDTCIQRAHGHTRRATQVASAASGGVSASLSLVARRDASAHESPRRPDGARSLLSDGAVPLAVRFWSARPRSGLVSSLVSSGHAGLLSPLSSLISHLSPLLPVRHVIDPREDRHSVAGFGVAREGGQPRDGQAAVGEGAGVRASAVADGCHHGGKGRTDRETHARTRRAKQQRRGSERAVTGARASCLTSLCVSSCHRLLLTRQCKIPWIGDAGVEILKKNGVKSYDALKAKFHDFDGDEKKFTEWLEGLGIQRHLAEKSAICYVDKFATQQ